MRAPLLSAAVLLGLTGCVVIDSPWVDERPDRDRDTAAPGGGADDTSAPGDTADRSEEAHV